MGLCTKDNVASFYSAVLARLVADGKTPAAWQVGSFSSLSSPQLLSALKPPLNMHSEEVKWGSFGSHDNAKLIPADTIFQV